MIEDLKKVRDSLYDSKAEFWDDWHSNMSEGDFENHWLIMDINKSLATIDRIIAGHSPDASKMVVPDGYKLVPIEPTVDMMQAGSQVRKDIKELSFAAGIADTFHGRDCCAALDRVEDFIIKNISAAPTPAPTAVDFGALKRELRNEIIEKYHMGVTDGGQFGDAIVAAETQGVENAIDHLAATGRLKV